MQVFVEFYNSGLERNFVLHFQKVHQRRSGCKSESAKLCALHCLVPYVSRSLLVLILHEPSALCPPLPQMPRSLSAPVPHVPGALRAIVPYVLSCLRCFLLCALLLLVFRASCALTQCALVPRTLSYLTCPLYFVPCVFHVPLSSFLFLFSHNSLDFFLFISRS